MIDINEKEIGIITLGTGCAAPTLKRRLPATAVIQKGSVFLFDAGEGTQIQYRKPKLHFNKLQTLFISHLHGDHVTGIMGLLMSMALQNRYEPLLIIGPPGIKEYIEANRRMLKTNFRFQLNIYETEGNETIPLNDDRYVKCLPLEHRIFCLGYRFMEKIRPGTFFPDKARALGIKEGPLWGKLQNGESIRTENGNTILPQQVMSPQLPGRIITYCTDTRPCLNAKLLAENADVLIFDGTFASGDKLAAQISGHSTVNEAFQLALDANAKSLLLTHISARYTRIKDSLDSIAFSNLQKVAVANDLDTWILPWKGSLSKR